jgi:hypothetical protein
VAELIASGSGDAFAWSLLEGFAGSWNIRQMIGTVRPVFLWGAG